MEQRISNVEVALGGIRDAMNGFVQQLGEMLNKVDENDRKMKDTIVANDAALKGALDAKMGAFDARVDTVGAEVVRRDGEIRKMMGDFDVNVQAKLGGINKEVDDLKNNFVKRYVVLMLAN